MTLVLVLVAAILFIRKGGAVPPHGVEQAYFGLSIVPFVLTILVPAVIGLVWGYGPENKRWIDGSSRIGLALSATLGVWGGLLVARAVGRGSGLRWPLGAAVLLAAGPAVMVFVSWALLYGLGHLL